MHSPLTTELLITFLQPRLCILSRIINVHQCLNQVSGITWWADVLALINPLSTAYRVHGTRIRLINRTLVSSKNC